jgi:hypothetical protein
VGEYVREDPAGDNAKWEHYTRDHLIYLNRSSVLLLQKRAVHTIILLKSTLQKRAKHAVTQL